MKAKQLYEQRVGWFKDRIGKRVYRADTSCECDSCKRVSKEGLIISDSDHAVYLANVSGEMGIKYFDEPLFV